MRERRWIVVILASIVLMGFTYGWLMPPWEAPDEPAHYVLVANLTRINKFSTIEANYEAHQPQTYYRFASLPLKVLFNADREWIAAYRPESNYDNLRFEIPVFDWNAENYRFLPGLYLLRSLNVLLGAWAVYWIYLGLRKFFPGSKTDALSATVLMAFMPQFLHTISTVNNDTIGILAGAGLFWVLGNLVSRDFKNWEYGLAALAALTLPFVTKLTVFPMSAAVLLAVIQGIRMQRGIRWRSLIWIGIGSALVVLAAFIVFPAAGDIVISVVSGRLFQFFDGAFAWETIWMMLSQLAWTFWGKVGWIGAGLPGWVILILTVLATTGLGLSIFYAIRNSESRTPRLTWGIIAACIAWFVVVRNGFYSIANQGRLIYPSLGVISFTIIAGWRSLLSDKIRARLPWLIAGMWLVLNLWLIFDKVLPIYYQPFE